MSNPSRDALTVALGDAGVAHHDYEQVALGGERDELWPGFDAAYALGRLGGLRFAQRSEWLAGRSSYWRRLASVGRRVRSRASCRVG